MSAQRAGASAAASAPGPSASRMASARAEPFAYASATRDCHWAPAAERRPDARVSQMIRPMTRMTARAIKTHPSGETFARPVGELVGEGVADAGDGEGDGDGDGDGGAVVTSGVGGALVGAADVGMLGGEMVTPALAAALLRALPALLTASQPAIRNTAAKKAAARITKPFQRPFDITAILGLAGRRVFTRCG